MKDFFITVDVLVEAETTEDARRLVYLLISEGACSVNSSKQKLGYIEGGVITDVKHGVQRE